MISLKSIEVNEFNKKPVDSTSLKRSIGVKHLVLVPEKVKTGRSLEPRVLSHPGQHSKVLCPYSEAQGPVSENRELLGPLVNGSNVNQK